MPAIEPYVRRREEKPPPRFIRLRFVLAALVTIALMVGVVALIAWLPPII
jgi:hypothetical protein